MRIEIIKKPAGPLQDALQEWVGVSVEVSKCDNDKWSYVVDVDKAVQALRDANRNSLADRYVDIFDDPSMLNEPKILSLPCNCCKVIAS